MSSEEQQPHGPRPQHGQQAHAQQQHGQQVHEQQGHGRQAHGQQAHGEQPGAPQGWGPLPQGWEPLPQGEYDSETTAYVRLPEGLLDPSAVPPGADPLAAPGHGYVPPQLYPENPASGGPDLAAGAAGGQAGGGYAAQEYPSGEYAPGDYAAGDWTMPFADPGSGPGGAAPGAVGHAGGWGDPGATGGAGPMGGADAGGPVGGWGGQDAMGGTGGAGDHAGAVGEAGAAGGWSVPIAPDGVADESGAYPLGGGSASPHTPEPYGDAEGPSAPGGSWYPGHGVGHVAGAGGAAGPGGGAGQDHVAGPEGGAGAGDPWGAPAAEGHQHGGEGASPHLPHDDGSAHRPQSGQESWGAAEAATVQWPGADSGPGAPAGTGVPHAAEGATGYLPDGVGYRPDDGTHTETAPGGGHAAGGPWTETPDAGRHPGTSGTGRRGPASGRRRPLKPPRSPRSVPGADGPEGGRETTGTAGESRPPEGAPGARRPGDGDATGVPGANPVAGADHNHGDAYAADPAAADGTGGWPAGPAGPWQSAAPDDAAQGHARVSDAGDRADSAHASAPAGTGGSPLADGAAQDAINRLTGAGPSAAPGAGPADGSGHGSPAGAGPGGASQAATSQAAASGELGNGPAIAGQGPESAGMPGPDGVGSGAVSSDAVGSGAAGPDALRRTDAAGAADASAAGGRNATAGHEQAGNAETAPGADSEDSAGAVAGPGPIGDGQQIPAEAAASGAAPGGARSQADASGDATGAEAAVPYTAESTDPAADRGEPDADPESGAEDDPAAADAGDDPHSEHPHASYVLSVNGVDRPVTEAWIGESLLYVLRERLGLAGAKDGCSQGECGACSVQVDGRLVASCLVPAATAAGSEVRTVEGLAADGVPSDVQRALAASGAVQCGFCVPGLAMTVHDLLEGNHAPTDLETRRALSGNLCRCSGYRGVLDAVRGIVESRAEPAAEQADGADDGGQAGAGAAQEGQPTGRAAGAARIPHQADPYGGDLPPGATS